MKFLKKLFKRDNPPPQVDIPPSRNSYLLVTVSPEGKIEHTAHFARHQNNEDFSTATRTFAKMLFLLNRGSLTPVLQRAVAEGGKDGPYHDGFAHLVLDQLNQLILSDKGVKGEDDLVIEPSQTFGYNNDEDDE